MSSELLELIKNHLEKSVGDIGILIYHKSISKLNIGKNPSRKEIEKLILYIEKKLTTLYGIDKSKAISDELYGVLAGYDKFLENMIMDTLEDFFSKKGIPGESDTKKIARHLISEGYNQDDNKLIETINQLSKRKIASSLNNYIINNEVKSFIDASSAYAQTDVENFINYLKSINPDVNDSELKEKIEKERLYRKFNYIEGEQNNGNEIFRQYIALVDSGKNKKGNSEYTYILSDEDLLRLVEKIKVRFSSLLY